MVFCPCSLDSKISFNIILGRRLLQGANPDSAGNRETVRRKGWEEDTVHKDSLQ